MVAAGFNLRKIRTAHTLGEKLRRARKRKGVDLIEAELSTKVRAKYLEALENEDFDLLPNDIYTNGFLQNYANYLGLDSEKILQLWEHQKVIRNCNDSKNFCSNDVLKDKTLIITPKLITVLIGSLSCLAIFAYIIFQVASFASVPKLLVSAPSSNVIVESEQILVSGQTDVDANLKINNEKVMVDSNGNFSVYIALQNGINTIVVTATNKANKADSKTFIVERKIKTAEK